MPARESFAEFLKRRTKASEDYINGSADTMLGMNAMTDPATFFPPNGTVIVGAERINQAVWQTARSFMPGSKVVRLDVLQSASDVEMGFWSGVVHAEMSVKGQGALVTTRLRITEVFRRNEAGWKLIHRHADKIEG